MNTVASLPAKLLPCPFCGHEDTTLYGREYFACQGCGAFGPSAKHVSGESTTSRENRARELWNTRAALATPAGEGGLPPLPQAFFDEFGESADDRVQDYARAAIARRLATPEQPGSAVQGEAVAKLVNRIDSDGGKTTTLIRPTGLGLDLPIGEYPLYLHAKPCECRHEWQADPDFGEGSGYLYCPKCSVTRRSPKATTPPPAPAAEQGEPVAWKYEHDGCMDEPIITKTRWKSVGEPWTETPVYEPRDTACPKCGATSEDDAGSKCIPDGDSCPGVESPLAEAWAQPEARGVEGMVDDRLSLSDVAGVLGEIAEQFDGGEYSVSEESRRVLIDFAHGLPDHPLFIAVGHYFAQNPAPFAATPNPVRAEQPEGKWKLVPVEPTEAMLFAMQRARYGYERGDDTGQGSALAYFDQSLRPHMKMPDAACGHEYRAMLASAPAAPVERSDKQQHMNAVKVLWEMGWRWKGGEWIAPAADEVWPAIDRLLGQAYGAGLNGEAFDILAARAKVTAALAGKDGA